MDPATQTAVTKALDASIAYVATREFDRLSKESGDQEIVATKIYKALRSFQRLQRFQDQDRMPNYNQWDALLYLTWFQPSQINLAYTLFRKILEGKNPTISGSLQVVDYGCGAFAMQFGLALAAAETRAIGSGQPQIAIHAIDKSTPMRRIGLELWHRFVKEVNDAEKYPTLTALRLVLKAIKPCVRRAATTRWLTALHVAYEENADAVKNDLDTEVREWKPEIVLVTSRREAVCWAYSLDENPEYEGEDEQTDITCQTLELVSGGFEATSALRQRIYAEKISDMPDALFDNDKAFACNYLTLYPTAWCTRGFNSIRRLYLRR